MNSPNLSKEYLSLNEIPQLFENAIGYVERIHLIKAERKSTSHLSIILSLLKCLMTGLLYHQPRDHVVYLQDCLEKIKSQGVSPIKWDLLVKSKHSKKSLPPIQSGKSESKEELAKKPALPLIPKERPHLQVSPEAVFILAITPPGTQLSCLQHQVTLDLPGFIFLSVPAVVREGVPSLRNHSIDDVSRRLTEGEFLDDNVLIDCLISTMNADDKAKGFVLHGYPKKGEHITHFEDNIGPVRYAFLSNDSESSLIEALAQHMSGTLGGEDKSFEEKLNRIKVETLHRPCN